jgi:dTDP-4-amino-4,6-dideoxygalactose transaminase
MTIPLLIPNLPDFEQIKKYIETIDGNKIYTNFGPLNTLLELRLSNWYFSKFDEQVHTVTTCNATLGLEVLIQELGLEIGSEILVPSLTFVATGTAIKRMGYVPIACDVDRETYLMTPESVSGVRLSNVTAAIPVSSFGIPQNAKKWAEWARANGKKIIIDAAAAFGSQQVLPEIPAVFSLHATKPLSSAEGGFILTTNEDQAATLKSLTNFGISGSHGFAGTNAKLSEYHAAIALASLDNWRATVSKRQILYTQYKSHLIESVGNQVIINVLENAYCISTLLIKLPDEKLRNRCEKICHERSIATRRWYTPLLFDNTATKAFISEENCPVAREFASTVIGLPFHLHLSDEDIKEIVRAVRDSIN